DYELHAIPKKQVILTTTDGHDIYRGGTYWAIEKGTWKIFRITDGLPFSQPRPTEEAYTFASGQAAEAFVENHKPTRNEPLAATFYGKKIFKGDSYWQLDTESWKIAKCTAHTPSQSSNHIFFSTEKEAQNYA